MFQIDQEYMVNIRRQLHMYPETDFDLPRTVVLVEKELAALDIPYTEQYGEGSVVGYINPDKEGFTIGIRADMDALNILEANDIPFKSKIEGKMHACGHDAHTAILLGTAKALKAMEKELACRVKLVFQPSEEGIKSGAGMMVEHGVLEEVDVIVALHVSAETPVGEISLCPGYSNASSRHFTVEIEGKSSHAAAYHDGIDALAIAVRMYQGMHFVTAHEVTPKANYVCHINKMEAGTIHNAVAAKAVMKGTIRTFDLELSRYLFDRIVKIGDNLAEETGAKITVTGPLKSACVICYPHKKQFSFSLSLMGVAYQLFCRGFCCLKKLQKISKYGLYLPLKCCRIVFVIKCKYYVKIYSGGLLWKNPLFL